MSRLNYILNVIKRANRRLTEPIEASNSMVSLTWLIFGTMARNSAKFTNMGNELCMSSSQLYQHSFSVCSWNYANKSLSIECAEYRDRKRKSEFPVHSRHPLSFDLYFVSSIATMQSTSEWINFMKTYIRWVKKHKNPVHFSDFQLNNNFSCATIISWIIQKTQSAGSFFPTSPHTFRHLCMYVYIWVQPWIYSEIWRVLCAAWMGEWVQ